MAYEEFDIQEFTANVVKRFCPECGAAIVSGGKGRPKKFCSARCCQLWWNKHEKPNHWKSARMVICAYCQKEFLSGREAYRPRIYCSRACANRGRRKGG